MAVHRLAASSQIEKARGSRLIVTCLVSPDRKNTFAKPFKGVFQEPVNGITGAILCFSLDTLFRARIHADHKWLSVALPINS